MSRKRKFYQANRMLRAGRVLTLVRQPVTAFQIGDDGVYRPIATCDVTAITRDGTGFPKEFARATAGVAPERLTLYTCVAAADADAMADQLNAQKFTTHHWITVSDIPVHAEQKKQHAASLARRPGGRIPGAFRLRHQFERHPESTTGATALTTDQRDNRPATGAFTATNPDLASIYGLDLAACLDAAAHHRKTKTLKRRAADGVLRSSPRPQLDVMYMELAAKACGYKFHWSDDGSTMFLNEPYGRANPDSSWDIIHNEGDSKHLEALLNIEDEPGKTGPIRRLLVASRAAAIGNLIPY